MNKSKNIYSMSLEGNHTYKRVFGILCLIILVGLILVISSPAKTANKHTVGGSEAPRKAVYKSNFVQNPKKNEAVVINEFIEESVESEKIQYINIEHEKVLMQRRQAPLSVYQASEELIVNETAKNLSKNSADLQVVANKVEQLDYTIIQGKLITGILETAINSELPGMIRAVVRENVYAEQGSNILIPKGSRLIGNYQSEQNIGHSRVFVLWNRLITPNGIEIQLDSTGTNTLGQAGLTGLVDRHFFARFGEAALLSLISAGASNINVGKNDEYNSRSSYKQALSESFSSSANHALTQNQNLGPTIHINQGTPIKVLVAKDLNFKNALMDNNL